MNEIADDEILSFAQKNASYYLVKWRANEITRSKISWNWAACLFGVFWLVYRKMYFLALAALAFIFVESYFEDNVVAAFFEADSKAANLISLGVTWVLNIVFGLFGNLLYFFHSKKKILQIKSAGGSEELQKTALNKQGGTSWWGVAILSILFIILIGWFLAPVIWGE